MIEPLDKFKEAKLKVRWAQIHIYKLIDQYSAFLASEAAQATILQDEKTGSHHLELQAPQELMPKVALIVGDVVHNLRTAFDYISIGITGIEAMSLPVGRRKSDLLALKRYKEIRQVNSTLADFIVDEIQPYHRGRYMLWELSELDRLDKHRLILPTIQHVHRLGMILEDANGKTLENRWVSNQSSLGARVLPGDGPFKIRDQGQSGISVSFGPGTPFNNEPVLETLDRLVECAPRAIQAFEEFYFGKNSDADSSE
ncbi:hypothetical protein [Bradyrhizobium sp. SRS-191]|uniref:hypothetical protein n=1 Tax=Bradyrhizobium sp. SRS-191 TaxID=2962606 RepID=UPI00211E5ADD|nr:hypothetical protein [Bradyrhizobium sp. SRS-191]